jgi:hypothetical protein
VADVWGELNLKDHDDIVVVSLAYSSKGTSKKYTSEIGRDRSSRT